MSAITIGRWGRSLAIRLPTQLADRLALAEGQTVEMEQRGDELVIRRAARPLTAAEMFAGRSADEWREIYREHIVDWGPDRGREIVEE